MDKILVEVSARHIHLTKEHVAILFGEGYELTPKKYLSQPGQFACEEKVRVVGPRGELKMSVLGPERKDSQVEVSLTDARTLGVEALVRESGDIERSGGILIEGPAGTLQISQGAIVAHNHIHVPTQTAARLGLKDKERVSVKILSERPVTFEDVIIRVREDFNFKMHIDFDEANAASVKGFTLGKIIKHT